MHPNICYTKLEFNNNVLWMEIDDNWELEMGSLLVGITLEGRKLLTLLSNALSKE